MYHHSWTDQPTPSSWCILNEGSWISQTYDILPCARRGILQGILPAEIVLISVLVFLLARYKLISVPRPEYKSDPIHEAENSAISDTLHKAGFSWGGLTLTKYAPADSKSSWKAPILQSQRRKDIAVFFLCILMLVHILIKIGYTALLHTSLYLKQGFSWYFVLFAVWMYVTFLSYLRLEISGNISVKPTYSILRNQFLVIVSLCIGIWAVDLQKSALELIVRQNKAFKFTSTIPEPIFTWIILVLVLMTYYSAVAFKRIRSVKNSFINEGYQSIEKHLQCFLGIYFLISVIELRHSMVDFAAQKINYGLLCLDCLAISISFSHFLLEFATTRTSRYDDERETSLSDKKLKPTTNPLSPTLNASILSELFYSYYGTFISKFFVSKLEYGDIMDIEPEENVAALMQKFRNDTAWMSGYRFRTKLAWHLRYKLLAQLFLSLLHPIKVVVPSIILKCLLDALSSYQQSDPAYHQPKHVILMLVALVPTCQLLGEVIDCKTRSFTIKFIESVQALLKAEIFAKALRRTENNDQNPSGDHNKASNGQVMNLFASDASQFTLFFRSLMFILPAPFNLLFISVLLFNVLGTAAIFGIITIFASVLLTVKFEEKVASWKRQFHRAKDHKLNVTSETIVSMKTIKLFSWGEHFLERLTQARKNENDLLIKSYFFRILQFLILNSSTNMVSFASFTVHTLILHRPLSPTIAFTSLSLFSALRAPMDALARKLARMNSALVSLDRIEVFLEEKDSQKYDILKWNDSVNLTDIGFHNAKFIWYRDISKANSQSQKDFVLDIGNLMFPYEKISVIAGPVASGKTSLLLALLGEMHRTDGDVFLPSKPIRTIRPDPNEIVDGSVAYCSQKPWLSSNTLRDNILFGSEYDPQRFDEVIQACALDVDFETMDHKDLTEIGQRGIVLSGGQKARVSFARALYSSAKTLLLDDILSAVDAPTAGHLVSHALNGPLMKNRTCILVTHQVSLCAPIASFVVYMNEGCVQKYGSPDDVELPIVSLESNPITSSHRKTLFPDKTYDERRLENDQRDRKAIFLKDVSGNGSVSLSVYKFYINAFGGWTAISTVLILYALSQLGDTSVQMWLRQWTHSYEGKDQNEFVSASDRERTVYYLKRYALLIFVSMVLVICRSSLTLYRGIVAGREVYNTLINRVINLPMYFFEHTPEGSIVNRMTKDMSSIDYLTEYYFIPILLSIFRLAGSIATISSVNATFIVIIILTFTSTSYVGSKFAKTNRELKRYSSATQSGFFQILGEGISGVHVIRAFGDSGRFLQDMMELIDKNSRPNFMLGISSEWANIRYQFVNIAMILGTMGLLLRNNEVDAATVGLVMTFILDLHRDMFPLTGEISKAEIEFNNVERVKEYCELKQEKIGGEIPLPSWPSRDGKIVVDNLSVKYQDELECVLHNVSFSVKPKEKVAIVGRTGSGKSTLMSTMFRIVEPTEGRIVIDGLDISKVKLSELRSRIAIVPQDSTLLTGSVRYNLDPFEQYQDHELYEILEKVGLTKYGLSTKVEEAGRNFSAGERQIFALARGLLRAKNSPIIFFDEPTSSLDQNTDLAVQKAIVHDEISDGDAIIVCIAHRISTIIGYDRVLVLGEGRVLEYDEPATLLERPDSTFKQLCLSTGEYEKLEAEAKAAHMKRRTRINNLR